MHVVVLALLGAAVGFVGGLFGKGGSAMATPLLAAIGVPPVVAVASPLPSTIPGTVAASYPYWADKRIDWKVVRWSVAFGLPATIAGAYATRWIDGGLLVDITKVLVIVLGIRFLLRPSGAESGAEPEVRALRARLAVVGFAVGIVSGLLANAGGFLLAPLYVAIVRLPIKTAFACSLTVAAVLAVPGTVLHALLGHIDWHVVAVFGATAIPLSYTGASVAVRTDSARLERLYGLVLVLIGCATVVVSH